MYTEETVLFNSTHNIKHTDEVLVGHGIEIGLQGCPLIPIYQEVELEVSVLNLREAFKGKKPWTMVHYSPIEDSCT